MSAIDWEKIQRKLEGRCEACGGELPNHIGICEIEADQLFSKLTIIDDNVKHIGDVAEELLQRYKDV
tara:strand:- start:720 stop:920 length:201 start_codon:yes stop_codon:yes gene_type:complete